MLDTFKPILLFISYWQRRPWSFAGMFLLGPAVVLQNIVSPLFVAKALGQLIATGHADISNVLYAGLTFAGGALLWFTVDYFIGIRLHSRTMEDIYNDCFEQLLQQDYAFFADNFSGSLVTQANRFAKAFDQFHVTWFLDFWGQICTVLTAIIITTYINTAIGLSVGVTWLLSFVVIAYLTNKRMPIRRKAVARESVQTGELADALTNAVTVDTFAAMPLESKRYGKTNSSRKLAFISSWRIGVRNNLYIALFGALLQVVVLIGGIRAVETDAITFATFLLFQVYIIRIIDSLHKSALSIRFFEGILGDAHEMTELFARKSAVQDPAEPETSRIDQGRVTFERIQFNYELAESAGLFDGFELDIQPGERVGLVGPSGGGKTTITKLLLRYMDIQAGAIKIDGQDIRSITRDDVHKAISYVPQEPLLFHRSLGENIGYGKPGASFSEIQTAAKRAHADEFISKLPQGYDTLVGERGVKLSGGQRQRVAIARAMLKNAPILLLDEATSALDSESEKLIQDALWKLMEGRTAVVIAHRLSTVQRMDKIVVLDHGKIVEQGSHQKLLKQKGLYAKLWSHQSGGFLDE